MVTGDKRTGQTKIRFGGSGHYGQITDERSKNVWEKKEKNSRKSYKYPI